MVDQDLRERLGPGIVVEITDPAGSLVVAELERMEKHWSRRGTDGIETSEEQALEVFEIGQTEEHDLVLHPCTASPD